MECTAALKRWAKALKRQIVALYFAAQHPRTPWYAKLVIGCVVAYALSPIDLIPDFIPVLGFLDDIILLPIGIYIALRLIPVEVMQECYDQASDHTRKDLPRNWKMAVLIISLWLLCFLFFARLAYHIYLLL